VPSEDLAGLVREANDAWNRGDLDAMFALFHPDFEWHTTPSFPGLDAVYRGPEGWRKFDHDFRETWESVQVLIEEVRQVDDKVVALANFQARGRDGIELSAPIAWVTRFRDGLAIRSDVYDNWNRALEAIGLSA
jgi:ketosteroid isomerase-like protein